MRSNIIVTTLLALFLSAAVSAAAADLVHNPSLSAAAGQDLVIQAALVGDAGTARVRLYWRPKGKELFRSVEMGGPASEISAKIPGEAIGISGLEYYIEASQQKNGKKVVIVTAPANNPLLNPYQVIVRKDQAGPEVTPLSPPDGGEVDSSRPVITAAFGDPDSGVDPASVLIKVDGKAASKGSFQAFESLVSYVPEADLANGEHEIVVTVRDRAGNPGSAKWKVTVKGSAQQQEKAGAQAWAWDGKVRLETQYAGALSQSSPKSPLPYRPYGVNRARLEVSGRGEENTLSLKVAKTDEERTDQQSVDRYTATWRGPEGVIGLGDFSPNFSELSLYQLYQLRGVTLDLYSGKPTEGHTRFVGVWGQTRRAIEQGSTGFAGGPATATFSQDLLGARWEFGSPYFQMGLNSVTVNDDASSVSNPGSQSPYYNWLSTSDVRIGIPQIGFSMSAEAGIDLYTDNTLLTGASAGSGYRAGLNWDYRPWETKLTFDFKDLGGGFGYLPGGYTAVANPGLVPDYRGYESSFDQGLFDGQFGLNLNWNHWRDNLQALPTRAVTTNDYYSIFTNVAPTIEGHAPSLVVGYSLSTQNNDADGVILSIVNLRTTILNLGLGYTRIFSEKGTASVNINYVRQDQKDTEAKRYTQDLGGDNVALSSAVTLGLSSFNVSVGVGGSDQPGVAAANTQLGLVDLAPRSNKSMNAGLRWSQQWIASVVDTYLGYDLGTQTSETRPFGAILVGSTGTSSRSTFSLGGGYNIRREQRVALDVNYAMVASETTALAVTVADNVTQLMGRLRYELSF